MSTDFEERIARLNAKNGVSPAVQPPAPPRGGRDGGRLGDKGPKGSIATYIVLGLLILVVMPIGAAMGTIYLAQNKETLTEVSDFR